MWCKCKVIMSRLSNNFSVKFKTKGGVKRLLSRLNLRGKKLQERCPEAALVGFISEEILKEGQVLLTDRAGQGGCLGALPHTQGSNINPNG